MNAFTLSPLARLQLAEQVSQNGAFTHSLHANDRALNASACVVIEQCLSAVAVRVEMGDSVNSITLARRADTSERVALFLEGLANGVSPSSVPEVEEYLLMSDLEQTLRDALQQRQGTFYLPSEDVEYLCLLLAPSSSDSARTVFRFELDSVGLTLPLILPVDSEQAYELLAGCVQELIATYRCAA